MWRQTWLDLHPDWKHILWTEEEVEMLPMVDREAYDHAEVGHASQAYKHSDTHAPCERSQTRSCTLAHAVYSLFFVLVTRIWGQSLTFCGERSFTASEARTQTLTLSAWRSGAPVLTRARDTCAACKMHICVRMLPTRALPWQSWPITKH